MNKKIILTVCFCGMALISHAQKAGGITPRMLSEITAQPEKTQAQKAVRNAVINNDIQLLAKGEAQRFPIPAHFSIETPSSLFITRKVLADAGCSLE